MAAYHTTLPTIPAAVGELSAVYPLRITTGLVIRISFALFLGLPFVSTLIAGGSISLVLQKSILNLVLYYSITSH